MEYRIEAEYDVGIRPIGSGLTRASVFVLPLSSEGVPKSSRVERRDDSLLVSPPGYACEVATVVEVNIEVSLPCGLDGFTDPPGQVNIGSSEQ